MNYLLLLIAIVLVTILSPIGLIYAMIKARPLSGYAREVAESIDQTGNVILSYAFNHWLIQEGGYKFGNKDETVSSVLGKNKRAGALTRSGKFLDRLLEKFDEGHSIDAIEREP